MDYANESYVRLYSRDTKTWLLLGYDGQNTLMHLLRRVDRAGVLDVDGADPAEVVSMVCRVPIEPTRSGLARILEHGVAVIDGGRLVLPRFLEAQETSKSDKARQRESRERRRAVDPRPKTNITLAPQKSSETPKQSQNVIECHDGHEAGHDVTPTVTLCCAVLPIAQHSEAVLPSETAEQPAAAEVVSLSKVGLAAVKADQARERAGEGSRRMYAVTTNHFDPDAKAHSIALQAIATIPIEEWQAIAKTLAVERVKPGVLRMLTPNHVLNNRHLYANGDAPGGRPEQKPQHKAIERPAAPYLSRVLA